MGNEAIERARERLLSSFCWTDGHADFAAVLRDAELLAVLGPALAAPFAGMPLTAVVGLEARGFAVGALVARALGTGLVLARKPGSVHPDAHRETAETPDWRGRYIELRISRSAIRPGDRVLLVDDWIETGSQARLVGRLARRAGASLVGVAVLLDDTTEHVRTELNVVGLVRSAELPPST